MNVSLRYLITCPLSLSATPEDGRRSGTCRGIAAEAVSWIDREPVRGSLDDHIAWLAPYGSFLSMWSILGQTCLLKQPGLR